MMNRERLMSWAFGVLMGGLLLGTSGGRAALTAPVDVGVTVPRWAIWTAAWLSYLAAS